MLKYPEMKLVDVWSNRSFMSEKKWPIGPSAPENLIQKSNFEYFLENTKKKKIESVQHCIQKWLMVNCFFTYEWIPFVLCYGHGYILMYYTQLTSPISHIRYANTFKWKIHIFEIAFCAKAQWVAFKKRKKAKKKNLCSIIKNVSLSIASYRCLLCVVQSVQRTHFRDNGSVFRSIMISCHNMSWFFSFFLLFSRLFLFFFSSFRHFSNNNSNRVSNGI